METLINEFHLNDEMEQKYLIMKKIREMTSKSKIKNICDILVDNNFVETLNRYLIKDDDNIVFESTWILTNILSTSNENTCNVVNQNTVNTFLSILQTTDNFDIFNQIVWAIGNILGNSIEHRNLLLEKNYVFILTNLLSEKIDDDRYFDEIMSWSLANCYSFYNQEIVQYKYIEPLFNSELINKFYSLKNNETISNIEYLLHKTIENENRAIENLQEKGTLHIIVSRLNNMHISTCLIKIIGNICAGELADILVEHHNIVFHLKQFIEQFSIMNHLNTRQQFLLKEMLWIISNLSVDFQQKVIDADFRHVIAKFLTLRKYNYEAKIEAMWILIQLSAETYYIFEHNDMLHAIVLFLQNLLPKNRIFYPFLIFLNQSIRNEPFLIEDFKTTNLIPILKSFEIKKNKINTLRNEILHQLY